MKEAKTIIIIFSLILIFMTLSIFIFPFCSSEITFDIIISIITGLFVSILTAVCQYFVIRGRTKDNVFNYYFGLYRSIYESKKNKSLIGYNVIGIWNYLKDNSSKLSEYLGDFSGFIVNEKNCFYKKINPNLIIDYNVFNIKNIKNLRMPFNVEKFEKVVSPIELQLQTILTRLDKKKFVTEFEEYKRISNLLSNSK